MSEVETIQERMRPVYIGRHIVGEISEQDWAVIVADVRSNRLLWQAQVRNGVRVLSRVLGFGFISVPLGVFWTAVTLGWLGRPVDFPQPGQHIGELLHHPDVVAPGIVLAIAAMLAIGLRLGYVDYFAKARSALVKERLGIDQPGQCRVR